MTSALVSKMPNMKPTNKNLRYFILKDKRNNKMGHNNSANKKPNNSY